MTEGRRSVTLSSVNASNQAAAGDVAVRFAVCDSVGMILLRQLLFLSMALSLPACHLVDQQDFNAGAGQKPAVPVVAAKPGPVAPALVTISYAEPNPPYRDALTAAVRAALARKPDAFFTVSTIVPEGATPEEAAGSGREVAQAIVSAGAAPTQVEQLVALDPAAKVREVVVRVQ